MKQSSKEKYAEYSLRTKVNYELAKNRLKGYREQIVTDDSETGIVTRWEDTLALKKVSLDDFERRIKKFATPDNEDELTDK